MNLPPPPPRTAAPAARPTPRKRSPWIFIGIGVIAAGVLAGTMYAGSQIPAFSDRVDALSRIAPDGSATVVVAEPVEWDIFIEPSTQSLSGTAVRITNTATGVAVDLRRSGNVSYEWFGRSGRSFARVSLDAGKYDIATRGAAFAIGIDPTVGFRRWIGITSLIMVPAVIGGVVISIVSSIRDTRRRNENSEPPAPSPWSSGEWPAGPGR
ncbi:MAG: hypothetical protein ACI9C1_000723 [Candidatus Aldehydirespiratoraceae bacterium]|jgi:hypothetical protein